LQQRKTNFNVSYMHTRLKIAT